jgi:hypothetical protein
MPTLEAAEVRREDGAVVIWLPIQWPVMTLSVLRRDTQELVWQIAHESFRRIEMPDQQLSMNVERLTTERLEQRELGSADRNGPRSRLRYGEAPDGMKQFVPADARPPELIRGVSYVVAVRERPGVDVRRFSFAYA